VVHQERGVVHQADLEEVAAGLVHHRSVTAVARGHAGGMAMAVHRRPRQDGHHHTQWIRMRWTGGQLDGL